MSKTVIKRYLVFACLPVFALLPLFGCDYGRMFEQESVKTYERKAMRIDGRSTPTSEGYNVLVSARPESLKNPLPVTKETVEQGRLAYDYYCTQCHGPKLDGNGVVGQSFSPLPADLGSAALLSQNEGIIYTRIRQGFRRHPKLFSTVSAEETWSVITFIKSRKQAAP
ncbi:MAG: hypothetical protein A4E57_02335 [Syntrophorhabdaceae bacterium PtaU1.Bin034]|nr:MAG: hypothetical protein A4E57_02335 [Syntrophorhabdaceae bacterium PtaU1.Bin034]